MVSHLPVKAHTTTVLSVCGYFRDNSDSLEMKVRYTSGYFLLPAGTEGGWTPHAALHLPT